MRRSQLRCLRLLAVAAALACVLTANATQLWRGEAPEFLRGGPEDVWDGGIEQAPDDDYHARFYTTKTHAGTYPYLPLRRRGPFGDRPPTSRHFRPTIPPRDPSQQPPPMSLDERQPQPQQQQQQQQQQQPPQQQPVPGAADAGGGCAPGEFNIHGVCAQAAMQCLQWAEGQGQYQVGSVASMYGYQGGNYSYVSAVDAASPNFTVAYYTTGPTLVQVSTLEGQQLARTWIIPDECDLSKCRACHATPALFADSQAFLQVGKPAGVALVRITLQMPCAVACDALGSWNLVVFCGGLAKFPGCAMPLGHNSNNGTSAEPGAGGGGGGSDDAAGNIDAGGQGQPVQSVRQRPASAADRNGPHAGRPRAPEV